MNILNEAFRLEILPSFKDLKDGKVNINNLENIIRVNLYFLIFILIFNFKIIIFYRVKKDLDVSKKVFIMLGIQL